MFYEEPGSAPFTWLTVPRMPTLVGTCCHITSEERRGCPRWQTVMYCSDKSQLKPVTVPPRRIKKLCNIRGVAVPCDLLDPDYVIDRKDWIKYKAATTTTAVPTTAPGSFLGTPTLPSKGLKCYNTETGLRVSCHDLVVNPNPTRNPIRKHRVKRNYFNINLFQAQVCTQDQFEQRID